jgi:ABC-type nitrate/sulfonate/bicarbonate transport system permease component
MNQLAAEIHNGQLAQKLEIRSNKIVKGALIGGGIGLTAGIISGQFRGVLTLIGMITGILVITSK